MSDASSNNPHKPPLWRRLLRVSSFTTAYLLCLAALLAFVIWILLDACFGVVNGAWLTPILCIAGATERSYGLTVWWNAMCHLAPVRMTLYFVLAGLAVGEGLTVLARLFIGKRGGRSVRSFLLATALIAGWLGLFVSYDELKWGGVRFRLQRRLPELNLLAEQLTANWPTKDTTLPVVGDVKCEDNLLVIRDVFRRPAFLPLNETIGDIIWRDVNGTIHIDVDVLSTDGSCKLEFLAPGTRPSSFDFVDNDTTVHHTLQRFWRLDTDVYLARYGNWEIRQHVSK